jgi:hypothetical protein
MLHWSSGDYILFIAALAAIWTIMPPKWGDHKYAWPVRGAYTVLLFAGVWFAHNAQQRESQQMLAQFNSDAQQHAKIDRDVQAGKFRINGSVATATTPPRPSVPPPFPPRTKPPALALNPTKRPSASKASPTPSVAPQSKLVVHVSASSNIDPNGKVVITNEGSDILHNVCAWALMHIELGRVYLPATPPSHVIQDETLGPRGTMSVSFGDLLHYLTATPPPVGASPLKPPVREIYVYTLYKFAGSVVQGFQVFRYDSALAGYVGSSSDEYGQLHYIKSYGQKYCAYADLVNGKRQ